MNLSVYKKKWTFDFERPYLKLRTGLVLATSMHRWLVVSSVFIASISGIHGEEFPEVYRKLKSPSYREVVKQVQENFREVYKRVSPSVVFISTETNIRNKYNPLLEDPYFRRFFPKPDNRSLPRKRLGLGSGFIISSQGYICTNYHVIKNVDKINIGIGDKTYPAKVVGVDPLADIALLKVKPKKTQFVAVSFANSDTVEVGDWAFSIGNPFGLDRSLTVGVVSAVRRNIDELGSAYIQTDASINQGNSGGPLLNYNGEVIGINRFIFSNSPTGGNLGIGFAIPINEVSTILNSLKKEGRVRRGFIGIQMTKVTPQMILDLEIPNRKGIYVVSVIKKSPAQKAGIKEGDVILNVGKRQVNKPRDIVILVSKSKIGSKVNFTIWRDQKKMKINVKVGLRPKKL